ncbi:MAG: tetratricopeptide repeat protein [Lewinellaceae bacterium]|nr:tetratricopeptide repeat protein [Saprospiraceae bacterium]MCB9331740.1 tetratricopeptide repeat protein [Lewinellaceae bacterium]
MNEQYIDTIHRYLNKTMTQAERNTFEAELQRDPELREAVELERRLLAGLEKAGEQRLQQTIGTVHTKLKDEGFFAADAKEDSKPELTITYSSNRFTMRKLISIAASLLVLAGAVWFFAIRDASVEAKDLYNEYYKPDTDVQRARDVIATLESHGLAGVPTDTDSLKTALELYEASKYDEALALLKVIAEAHPENDIAQYYIGVIHMDQERYAKAIEVLLPVSRMDNSDFKNQALWNLGLCYLRTENNQQDAYNVFQSLADDPEYPDHRNAKALLEQLLPKKKN